MLIWSKKIHCEMLSSFLVNLREYWCSLVQCCQHVSRFTGAPRAQPIKYLFYKEFFVLSHRAGRGEKDSATHI